jgi:hypothetical protein
VHRLSGGRDEKGNRSTASRREASSSDKTLIASWGGAVAAFLDFGIGGFL